MNVTGAFILFGVVILGYMLIAEAFTVLFRLTGLTREKAKFQVISLLTNSGYTTSESELITSSKIRRRLARATMLFGYSFTVTIVSIVVNIFITLPQAEVHTVWQGAVAMGVIVGIISLFFKFPRFRQRFDQLIETLGNRVMFSKGSNPIMILDNYGEKAMVQVKIEHLPLFLQGKTLVQSALKQNHHIQVLLIKRQGETLMHVTAQTILEEGDSVVLFGEYKSIRQVFEKPLLEPLQKT